MLARGILGSGQTGSVSSRPFPNSSGWWWLISSVFLVRISCYKTTHANGYSGAWPGWAVSISVLPLTLGLHWDFVFITETPNSRMAERGREKKRKEKRYRLLRFLWMLIAGIYKYIYFFSVVLSYLLRALVKSWCESQGYMREHKHIITQPSFP